MKWIYCAVTVYKKVEAKTHDFFGHLGGHDALLDANLDLHNIVLKEFNKEKQVVEKFNKEKRVQALNH